MAAARQNFIHYRTTVWWNRNRRQAITKGIPYWLFSQ